jgi:hypothetical protein
MGPKLATVLLAAESSQCCVLRIEGDKAPYIRVGIAVATGADSVFADEAMEPGRASALNTTTWLWTLRRQTTPDRAA